LTTQQKEDYLKSLSDLTNGNGNHLSILEGGSEFQPVSINPDDAQLIETRAFNTLQL
jgi:phage portal protein BeeE